MSESQNPYSPPQSTIEPEAANRSLMLASKGRRFGTLAVAYVLYLGLSYCFGMVIVVLFGDAGIKALDKTPDIVLGAFLFCGYYIFFEGIWARTPGKFLFGTLVVSETGAKPTLGQIIGRSLCRLIPFEAFSCLGERGWHDSIPKTRVIRA